MPFIIDSQELVLSALWQSSDSENCFSFCIRLCRCNLEEMRASFIAHCEVRTPVSVGEHRVGVGLVSTLCLTESAYNVVISPSWALADFPFLKVRGAFVGGCRDLFEVVFATFLRGVVVTGLTVVLRRQRRRFVSNFRDGRSYKMEKTSSIQPWFDGCTCMTENNIRHWFWSNRYHGGTEKPKASFLDLMWFANGEGAASLVIITLRKTAVIAWTLFLHFYLFIICAQTVHVAVEQKHHTKYHKSRTTRAIARNKRKEWKMPAHSVVLTPGSTNLRVAPLVFDFCRTKKALLETLT